MGRQLLPKHWPWLCSCVSPACAVNLDKPASGGRFGGKGDKGDKGGKGGAGGKPGKGGRGNDASDGDGSDASDKVGSGEGCVWVRVVRPAVSCVRIGVGLQCPSGMGMCSSARPHEVGSELCMSPW